MKKVFNKLVRDKKKIKRGGFEAGLFLESIDYFDETI